MQEVYCTSTSVLLAQSTQLYTLIMTCMHVSSQFANSPINIMASYVLGSETTLDLYRMKQIMKHVII